MPSMKVEVKMKEILLVRRMEILKILLNKDSPITMNEISKQLNVSNKTVRNDLNKIEEFLLPYNNIKIEKKPGVGTWLSADDDSKEFLKKLISKNHNYIEPWSAKERQFYIIRRLLQISEPIAMQILAEELYVSRVTIYKDLEGVEKWLGKYKLRLNRKQKSGIEIIGTESNCRKAVAGLLVVLEEDKEIKSAVNSQKQCYNNNITYHIDYDNIRKLIPNIDFEKIEEIIKEAEEKMDYLFSDDAFICLLVHIAISIERLKHKKDIEMNERQLQIIKEKKEYEIAKWIAGQIEEEFNINLPEAEIGYISLHILGVKILEGSQSLEDINKDLLGNMDLKVVELAEEIILLIGNILSVDFSKDDRLLMGLVLHLRPTINRLEYGLSIRNPLLTEIKEKYPSTFGASWASSILFEKHFGLKVTEEEIGYIAIHIGAALERQNEKIKAVIVCSSGIGTAQLIAIRLEKEIAGLEIMEITSVFELNKMKTIDFDIIISTVPLEYELKPTIVTSVFVTEEDIRNINLYIKNIENAKRFYESSLEIKNSNLFDQNLIFANMKVENKEELILKLGNLLVEKDLVNKEFVQSALDREKITSTAVGKGVAIPHGKQEFVKQPSIVLVTLENPITWSGEQVDIVFMLALRFGTGDITRSFFKEFYSMLDNDEILTEIREKGSAQEIYHVLRRKEDMNE